MVMTAIGMATTASVSGVAITVISGVAISIASGVAITVISGVAFSIASGVAVVNYDFIALADRKAVDRCPTGAIVWLDGAQFARQPTLAGSREA